MRIEQELVKKKNRMTVIFSFSEGQDQIDISYSHYYNSVEFRWKEDGKVMQLFTLRPDGSISLSAFGISMYVNLKNFSMKDIIIWHEDFENTWKKRLMIEVQPKDSELIVKLDCLVNKQMLDIVYEWFEELRTNGFSPLKKFVEK